jgi:uncharacterized protein YkwD
MKNQKHLQDVFVPHARNNYRPYVLRQKTLYVFAVFFVVLEILSGLSFSYPKASHAQGASLNRASLVTLTNSSRHSYRLGSVYESDALNRAAQAKAEDMLKNQYFAHTSPQGIAPWDFVLAEKYNYLIAGENLAINFSSAEGVGKAWMNSTGHKANILNKEFQEIGIGMAKGMYKGAEAIFVVQMFGTRAEQPMKVKVGYTKAERILGEQEVVLPNPTAVALQAPSVAVPGQRLINKEELDLAGRAYGADQVYVLRNDQPVAVLQVSNGEFSGKVRLEEGNNTISVIAYNKAGQSSVKSDPVRVMLDSNAPVVESQELYMTAPDSYVLRVRVQGDPVKVIGSVGEQNYMLQPTAEDNVWETNFFAGQLGQVKVSAYDLAGNAVPVRIAEFSETPIGTETAPAAAGPTINQNEIGKLFLYGIAFLMTVLMIKLAVKPNIQHLPTIAHTAALILMVTIFWQI